MANNSDTLEILEKVNAFYDSSWNKLIFFTSALIAIGSIIIPGIIQWYQRRSLKLSEQRLQNNISVAVEAAKTELQADMETRMSEKIEEYESKLEDQNNAFMARLFHLEGNTLSNQGAYMDALRSYTNSVEGYLKAQESTSIKQLLTLIDTCLNKLSLEEINENKLMGVDLEKALNEIELQDQSGGILSQQAHEILIKITKIPKTIKDKLESE